MQTFAREFFRRTPKDVHKTIGELYVIGHEVNKKSELDFVGNGHEVVVVKHQGQDRFVTAFNYRDIPESRAKVIFHTQRILATLFPHNFPRFKSTYYSSPQNAFHGATERQMVNEQDTRIKYPFENIEQTMEKAGMNTWFDAAPVNYIVGSDGGEYYVDVPNASHFGWDKEKALKFIENYKRHDGTHLDNADKRVIVSALNHLEELGVFRGEHD